MRTPTLWTWMLAATLLVTGCDDKPAAPAAMPAAAEPPSTPSAASPPPAPPATPDIIIDSNHVAVGKDQVATTDPALTDRLAPLLAVPGIESRAVDVVAMRNVKPSQVHAVLAALKRAKATGAVVKTLTRQDTTHALPVSFATAVPACTVVAWIAKDDAIHAWPAGGGADKRVIRGLAGPDITLGLEAVATRQEGCGASKLVVGGDDAKTWGLVFDLASGALESVARGSDVLFVLGATPGKAVDLK